jgi:hypothetical protein
MHTSGHFRLIYKLYAFVPRSFPIHSKLFHSALKGLGSAASSQGSIWNGSAKSSRVILVVWAVLTERRLCLHLFLQYHSNSNRVKNICISDAGVWLMYDVCWLMCMHNWRTWLSDSQHYEVWEVIELNVICKWLGLYGSHFCSLYEVSLLLHPCQVPSCTTFDPSPCFIAPTWCVSCV